MRFRLLFIFIFAISAQTFADKKGLTVYIFLAETCPICQSVSIELKKLDAQYKQLNVKFVGIFPDNTLSNEKTRKAFGKKYELSFPLNADSGQVLTKNYQAEITPEAVLVDDETQMILYRGKIDNSFASLGKRRTVVTEHYLRDAIESWVLGKKILISKTNPVGCIIQKNP